MKRILFAFLVALLITPLGGHFSPSVYAETALDNAIRNIEERRGVTELFELYGISTYPWAQAREAVRFLKRIKTNRALADAFIIARKLLTKANPSSQPHFFLDNKSSTYALDGNVVIGLKDSDADIIRALSISNK